MSVCVRTREGRAVVVGARSTSSDAALGADGAMRAKGFVDPAPRQGSAHSSPWCIVVRAALAGPHDFALCPVVFL